MTTVPACCRSSSGATAGTGWYAVSAIAALYGGA
jgi:hypothetical protein